MASTSWSVCTSAAPSSRCWTPRTRAHHSLRTWHPSAAIRPGRGGAHTHPQASQRGAYRHKAGTKLGRKSKLDDHQQQEAIARLKAGEASGRLLSPTGFTMQRSAVWRLSVRPPALVAVRLPDQPHDARARTERATTIRARNDPRPGGGRPRPRSRRNQAQWPPTPARRARGASASAAPMQRSPAAPGVLKTAKLAFHRSNRYRDKDYFLPGSGFSASCGVTWSSSF
jgi:hypothetical protein